MNWLFLKYLTMKKLYLIKNISLLLSFSICLSCTRESTKDKISSEKRDVNETKTHPRKTEISQSYICKSKNSNIVTKKKEFEITLCDGSRKKILRQQLSGKSSDNEDIYRTVNYKEFNKEIDAFEFEVFYAPLNNEGGEWGTSSLFISKVNGAEFEFSGFNDFTESKDKQFYAFVESDEIEVFDISILKKEKNGTLTKFKISKMEFKPHKH